MSSMTDTTFTQMMAGSRGAIHWANGYGHTKVEVLDAGTDWVHVRKYAADDERTLVVPLTSILYYQFEGEND